MNHFRIQYTHLNIHPFIFTSTFHYFIHMIIYILLNMNQNQSNTHPNIINIHFPRYQNTLNTLKSMENNKGIQYFGTFIQDNVQCIHNCRKMEILKEHSSLSSHSSFSLNNFCMVLHMIHLKSFIYILTNINKIIQNLF